MRYKNVAVTNAIRRHCIAFKDALLQLGLFFGFIVVCSRRKRSLNPKMLIYWHKHLHDLPCKQKHSYSYPTMVLHKLLHTLLCNISTEVIFLPIMILPQPATTPTTHLKLGIYREELLNLTINLYLISTEFSFSLPPKSEKGPLISPFHTYKYSCKANRLIITVS